MTKNEYNKALQDMLSVFNLPTFRRKDYKWLRNNLHIFENNRNFLEIKTLIIKLLELENLERLQFVYKKNN